MNNRSTIILVVLLIFIAVFAPQIQDVVTGMAGSTTSYKLGTKTGTCTDDDGGVDPAQYNTKGAVSRSFKKGFSWKKQSSVDYCKNSNTLIEYTCAKDAKISSSVVNCPCLNGKCITAVTYSCTGIIPSTNADLCSGDNTGLTVDTSNSLVSSCTTTKKCEYTCKSGYTLSGGQCTTSTAPATCTDDCTTAGSKRCGSLYYYQICKSDYDSDPCLEWDLTQNYCLYGQVCSNGECVTCTDTDVAPGAPDGKNYNTFGTVCLGTSCKSDVCANTYTLSEGYCFASDIYKIENYSCSCQNGKCL